MASNSASAWPSTSGSTWWEEKQWGRVHCISNETATPLRRRGGMGHGRIHPGNQSLQLHCGRKAQHAMMNVIQETQMPVHSPRIDLQAQHLSCQSLPLPPPPSPLPSPSPCSWPWQQRGSASETRDRPHALPQGPTYTQPHPWQSRIHPPMSLNTRNGHSQHPTDSTHLIFKRGVPCSLCVQLLLNYGAAWLAALSADQALDLGDTGGEPGVTPRQSYRTIG